MHLASPYIVWLLVFLVLPTVVLWVSSPHLFWRYRHTLLVCTATVVALGIPGDYFAIFNRMWGWPQNCCVLPRVGGLPLEEIVFMILMALFTSSVVLVVRDIFLGHLNHKK